MLYSNCALRLVLACPNCRDQIILSPQSCLRSQIWSLCQMESCLKWKLIGMPMQDDLQISAMQRVEIEFRLPTAMPYSDKEIKVLHTIITDQSIDDTALRINM